MQSASWLPTKQTQKHWENANFMLHVQYDCIWYEIWLFLFLFVASLFFPLFFWGSVMLFGTKAQKTTVCSNVGWPLFRVCWVERSFEKGWAIMALGASTPVWRCALFFCVCFFFGGRCDWRGIVVLDGVEMKKIRKYWKWIIYYIIIYNYYIYIHIYIYVKLPLQGVFVSLCFIELLWYS